MNRLSVLVVPVFVVAVLAGFTGSVHGADKPATRRGGFSAGISMGFQPNMFNLSGNGEDLGGQNTRILSRINRINDLYSNNDNSKVVRDFRYGGNSLSSMPVEVHAKYSFYGLLLRMGFVYHNIMTDTKSYVSRVGPGTSRRYPGSDANLTLYEDITDLYDTRSDNDEELARGLRPTYAQDVRFTQYFTGTQIEIPVTLAVSMFDLGPASFFFGGGMTFIYAEKNRVITAEILDEDKTNQAFYNDDVDKFTGRAIAFHIMTGAEYRFTPRVGVLMDLTFTFGTTGAIRDSVVNGAYSNNSLFHRNDNLDKGGNEKREDIAVEQQGSSFAFGEGVERTSSVDFSGFRIMIGLSYHLAPLDDVDSKGK